MINEDDVKNKTPALEQLLIALAREAGAEKAILFDGSTINLVNSADDPQCVMLKNDKTFVRGPEGDG